MDKKGFSELFFIVVILFVAVIGLFVMEVILRTQLQDIQLIIKDLQRIVELQDEEILELHGKNAQLQDEIKSLEIFDCTFNKFPELRDHYYNKLIEEGLQ